MADRFPLILNTSNNQIQEIASGDNLDLTGTGISNAGIITAGNVTIGAGTTDLIVTGDARITGILTVGTGSITLNETANTINVGTALTLGHTQGLQFHTQNLHSAGFEVNQINASGITTIGGKLDTNGVIEAIAGENKIPFLYADLASLPSASTYHGMFAHVHATGRGYYAHGGAWYELVNKDTNGNVALNKDLDVDGHTNLDNVSIAGVTTISGAAPNLLFTETDANPDFGILLSAGQLKFQDVTNGANILTLDDDKIQAVKNLDALAGIDVTGNLIASGNLTANNGNITVSGTAPKITFTETNDNPDYKLEANGGNIAFVDTTNSATRLSISSSGINVTGNGTFSGNVSVGGVLTYEDVTNVDSVGLVTARAGVFIPDDQKLKFGNTSGSPDLTIEHVTGGSYNRLHATNGYMQYRASAHFFNDAGSTINFIRCENKGVKLKYNGGDKLTTETGGVNITGVCTATSFVGDGSNLTGIAPDKIFEGDTEVECVDSGSGGAVVIKADGTNVLGAIKGGTNFGKIGINQFNHRHSPLSIAHTSTASADVNLSLTAPPASISVGGGTAIFMKSSNDQTLQKRYGTLIQSIRSSNDNGSPEFVISKEKSDASQMEEQLRIDKSGHILPGAHNTQNLGATAKRWANIYTADLQLSNKGKTNDVDNTWGDYTIQEGESDLFLINNRSGKKYKFNLTEVS